MPCERGHFAKPRLAAGKRNRALGKLVDPFLLGLRTHPVRAPGNDQEPEHSRACRPAG
jgi:hypothetical protein